MTRHKILIMGGDNVVGRALTEALRRSDWAEPVQLPQDGALNPATVDGAKGLVNATLGHPPTIRRRAADAAVLAGANPQLRLVQVGSMTVYGSIEGRIDETRAPRADLGSYAAAQIEAERIVRRHPNTVVLRPGCEYGPGCGPWSQRIARLLLARRLGDLGASGDGFCNLLYIDDLVAAIVQCLREDGLEGQTFNLAEPSPPTWNEYLMCFGVRLGATPVRRIGARRLLFETLLFAPALKALERLGAHPPEAVTSSLIKLCGQRIALDVTLAESRLGLRWTPREVGLAATVAALRSG